MIETPIITALIGVILGGGGKALQAWHARRQLASATLSALVAEVEGLTRLVRHRNFREGIIDLADGARHAVETGLGHEQSPFMQFAMTGDYFVVYKASIDKIGILDPYQADRIVRFYLLAKSLSENYAPTSPWQQGATYQAVLGLASNDLQLIEVLSLLGNEIASFRTIKHPAGRAQFPEPPAPALLPLINVETAHLRAAIGTAEADFATAIRAELDRRASLFASPNSNPAPDTRQVEPLSEKPGQAERDQAPHQSTTNASSPSITAQTPTA